MIYTRVSKDDGTSTSPAAQHDECAALAAHHGWPQPTHLSDVDLSAWRRNVARPAWQQTINGIRHGEIDGLIVHHLDRMLRQVRELEELIDAIEHRTRGRFPIYSVHGAIDLSTADGRFHARILTSVAQKESDDKSRRLKLVLGKAARDGKNHGGIAPYGWQPDRRTLNPQETAVIHQIINQALNGTGLSELARQLNTAGTPTRKGGRWYPTTVKQILTSPRLAGYRTHNGRVVATGDWEPIIDPATHHQLVELFNRPAHPNHHVNLTYWATGLAECGRCGGTLRSRQHHTQGRRYTCRKDHHGCGLGIAAEPFEHVVAAICQNILTVHGWGPRVETDADTATRHADIEHRLAELARHHYVDQAITRIEYEAARGPLAAQLEQLEQTLDQPARPAGRVEWDDLNASERSALAAHLIERIVIHPAIPGRRFDPSRIELWTRAR